MPSSPASSSTSSIWPSLPPSPASELTVNSTVSESREPLQWGEGMYRRSAEEEDGSEDNLEDEILEIRPPGVRFTVVQESENFVRRFQIVGRSIVLRVNNPPDECDNPMFWIELAMRDIHAYVISLVPDDDTVLVGVAIRSEHFLHGTAGLSFRPPENFYYDDLWNLISSITQSNQHFQVDDSFILQITFISIPVGSGAIRTKKLSIDSVSQRSIVSINNQRVSSWGSSYKITRE